MHPNCEGKARVQAWCHITEDDDDRIAAAFPDIRSRSRRIATILEAGCEALGIEHDGIPLIPNDAIAEDYYAAAPSEREQVLEEWVERLLAPPYCYHKRLTISALKHRAYLGKRKQKA